MNYDIDNDIDDDNDDDDDNDTEAYQLHLFCFNRCNVARLYLLALFFNKAAETILIVASNSNDVQAFR